MLAFIINKAKTRRTHYILTLIEQGTTTVDSRGKQHSAWSCSASSHHEIRLHPLGFWVSYEPRRNSSFRDKDSYHKLPFSPLWWKKP